MTVPNTRRTATTSAGPSPLRGYGSAPRNFDRHAVFVGNLPSDATQEQLAGIFGKYGVIMSIQVTSRPAPQGMSETWLPPAFGANVSCRRLLYRLCIHRVHDCSQRLCSH